MEDGVVPVSSIVKDTISKLAHFVFTRSFVLKAKYKAMNTNFLKMDDENIF